MSLLQLPAGRLQGQERLFSQLTGDRMRGNGLRLCQGRFSVGVRRISLQKGTGTGCPGCWWHPHPRGCFRGAWMWHEGTWLSGGPGTVRCWLDLRLFKTLFQPKDAVTIAFVSVQHPLLVGCSGKLAPLLPCRHGNPARTCDTKSAPP